MSVRAKPHKHHKGQEKEHRPLQLPHSAVIGHEHHWLHMIQSYVNLSEEAGSGETVKGYALSKNPASDGSFEEGNKELLYYWTDSPETNGDDGIWMCGADWPAERIAAGKHTWLDSPPPAPAE